MKLGNIKLDRRRIAVILLCLLIAATVAFIFGNSLKSRAESGAQSHGLADFLQSLIDPSGRIDRDVFHTAIRKLAHFTEFFALGCELALLRYLLCGRLLGVGLFSVAFTLLATANTDEFIQSFTGRGSLVSDALIDFSGGLTGAGAALLVIHIILRVIGRRRGRGQSDSTTENDARREEIETSSSLTRSDSPMR